MASIPDHFKIAFEPVADAAAVVTCGNARFTVLTDRLIRLEYHPQGRFEDRASQAFWFRKQPVPQFKRSTGANSAVIETEFLRLEYAGGEFAPASLMITLQQMGTTWHFGDADTGNLGGTGRTLDGVDGSIPLEKGFLSRDGWAIIDDGSALVFNQDCWLIDRDAVEGSVDLYFLGYGHDYLACLIDQNKVSGAVPMIPRWALGNWWSRFWAYSQEELIDLMDDFNRHEIPLGVCIIDMDWHITKTGNKSSGWTGYTWNRDLFPDPEGLLGYLHQKNLYVALNLHPAEGIHPHEAQYPEMAMRLGMDPASGEPVTFDIANPEFVNVYFDLLHHPQEKMGIDFWWMDWQQGTASKVKGLDPLWWFNHLHFYDLGRDGKKRSFVFSRWGGFGNHRYPIGFSGDTVVSWESLAFQPYFTATAANVNYGWWSHDIGGHMRGVEDGELYARWIQYGVFSPILRLHSTKNRFQERRPWGYDAEIFRVAKDAMQLRHAIVPYLYSMGWRYRRDAVPPILPMYYEHAETEAAYHCPNQYLFGSELVAAPFTSPMHLDTTLSRQVVWLPGDEWFGFANGEFYPNGWHSVYGGLDEIPLFARAGAIVPLAARSSNNGLPNPTQMDVYIFPGADGHFDLYEDDGDLNAYLEGEHVITPLTQVWNEGSLTFELGPARGRANLTVAQREYRLYFRGVSRPNAVSCTLNGTNQSIDWSYDPGTKTLSLSALNIKAQDILRVVLSGKHGELLSRDDRRLAACQKMVSTFKLPSGVKESLYLDLPAITGDPVNIVKYFSLISENQSQALVETLLGAGVERIKTTGKADELIVWNNTANSRVRRLLSATGVVTAWWQFANPIQRDGVAPEFEVISIGIDMADRNWRLQLNLADLLVKTISAG